MTESETAAPDKDARVVNDKGDEITPNQMFYFAWKEGADIERTDDGYLVNGDLYRPVDEQDEE